jgi:hypothetical protein
MANHDAELEAAIAELIEEMEGDQGDAHEIHMRLRQLLDQMRATGMPLPDDLVRLEKGLSEEFAEDASRRAKPKPKRGA